MITRYHTHPKFLPHPAKHITLRGNSEDEYAVVDVTRLGKPGGAARILEHMETSRALFELYEGAVVGNCLTSACARAHRRSVHPSRNDVHCKH